MNNLQDRIRGPFIGELFFIFLDCLVDYIEIMLNFAIVRNSTADV